MTEKPWYYEKDSHAEGPVSVKSLAEMFAQGHIREETLVWSEGLTEWQPFKDCSALLVDNPNGIIKNLEDYDSVIEIIQDDRFKRIINSEVKNGYTDVFIKLLKRHLQSGVKEVKGDNWSWKEVFSFEQGSNTGMLVSKLGFKKRITEKVNLSCSFAYSVISVLCCLAANPSVRINSISENPGCCKLETNLPLAGFGASKSRLDIFIKDYDVDRTVAGRLKILILASTGLTRVSADIEYPGIIAGGWCQSQLDNLINEIKQLSQRLSMNKL